MTANHFRHGPSLATLPMSGHAKLHSTPLPDGDQACHVELKCIGKHDPGHGIATDALRLAASGHRPPRSRVHNPFGNRATYA
jgi:hypothetical protein